MAGSACLAGGATTDANAALARLEEQARRLSERAYWEGIAADDAFAQGQFLVAMQHYGNGESYRREAAAVRDELERTDPRRRPQPSRPSTSATRNPRRLFEPERIRVSPFAQRPFGVRPSGSIEAADDVVRRLHAAGEDPPLLTAAHVMLALVVVFGPIVMR